MLYDGTGKKCEREDAIDHRTPLQYFLRKNNMTIDNLLQLVDE